MIDLPPDIHALVEQCAPNVGTTTMLAIIKTESGGDPFILADAGPKNLPWAKRKFMVKSIRSATKEDAAKKAKTLLNNGHIVAIGLSQINANNLSRLGYSIEDILDPCTNIKAGSKILADNYENALDSFPDKTQALHAAISAYESGNFVTGFTDGYVKRVLANAGSSLKLHIPNLKAGDVVSGLQGSFIVDQAGNITPFNAPLDAWKPIVIATNKNVKPEPEKSQLSVAGF